MPSKELDQNALGMHEDWYGNNAAFTCPACRKVYLVSEFLNKKGRACPNCGKSTAWVTSTSARIQWAG